MAVHIPCGPRDSFDREMNRPMNVMEYAMRKKGIPEILVRSVMSLYEGAKTRVMEDSELSKELKV